MMLVLMMILLIVMHLISRLMQPLIVVAGLAPSLLMVTSATSSLQYKFNCYVVMAGLGVIAISVYQEPDVVSSSPAVILI